jgi:hypothetical protein
MQVP